MGDKGSHWEKISHARIAALAAKQYGHVTRTQLLKLGLGTRAISYRIAAGTLLPAHAGVYAVGHRRPEPAARAAAAVLACGPNAVLSHASAASLWGLHPRWTAPIEVTITRGDRRPPGIRTHRSRTMPRADIRLHLGIWVTSSARTLLDNAPRTPEKILTRQFNDARRAGIVHLGQLRELVERCPNHPGAKRLRPLVEIERAPTRSEFEDAFLAFASRFGLPQPRINAHVGGYEVDALFEPERLIVELDGYEFHRDRTSFAADRERDAEMLRLGFATVRITYARLRDHPHREAARLREILGRRAVLPSSYGLLPEL